MLSLYCKYGFHSVFKKKQKTITHKDYTETLHKPSRETGSLQAEENELLQKTTDKACTNGIYLTLTYTIKGSIKLKSLRAAAEKINLNFILILMHINAAIYYVIIGNSVTNLWKIDEDKSC